MGAVRRLVFVTVAAAAVGLSGCLAAALGVGAGAAAAGVAYAKGRMVQEYPASLDDTLAAVRTGLVELRLPLVRESREAEAATIESRVEDSPVHIQLESVPSRLPAEGRVTRVSIRVGTFGDDGVSSRILTQTGLHLVAPVQYAPAPPLAAPQPPPPPVQQANQPTAPPPLAAPEPTQPRP